MDDKKLHSMLMLLGGKVLDMLTKRKGLSYEEAANTFYTSKLYELMSIEETKIWHFSAELIYTLLLEELETGKITFPEEQ